MVCKHGGKKFTQINRKKEGERNKEKYEQVLDNWHEIGSGRGEESQASHARLSTHN